jgi:hypothetical protein
MNFQKFLWFEAVLPNLITIFEMAREFHRTEIRDFVLSVILDVMAVANMLTKVVLALEPFIASIPMRLLELARRIFKYIDTVSFTLGNKLGKHKCSANLLSTMKARISFDILLVR